MMPADWCEQCGGDGTLSHVGGPGYFSESFGNYLPTDKLVRCEACNGTGRAEPAEADDDEDA